MSKRKPTRPPRAGARRAAGGGALLARLAALEDRVARLETGKPPPGDGRSAVPQRRAVRRCPGCGLPLRVLRGRCASCDRPADV
jgi:hypothetical protein